MSYSSRKPCCQHHASQPAGLFALAGNLLNLGYSLAWAGARGGRALLERAVWMDHSPGCPRDYGCGSGCHCCQIECLPPVYAGCCRPHCGCY